MGTLRLSKEALDGTAGLSAFPPHTVKDYVWRPLPLLGHRALGTRRAPNAPGWGGGPPGGY